MFTVETCDSPTELAVVVVAFVTTFLPVIPASSLVSPQLKAAPLFITNLSFPISLPLQMDRESPDSLFMLLQLANDIKEYDDVNKAVTQAQRRDWFKCM